MLIIGLGKNNVLSFLHKSGDFRHSASFWWFYPLGVSAEYGPAADLVQRNRFFSNATFHMNENLNREAALTNPIAAEAKGGVHRGQPAQPRRVWDDW